MREYLEAIAGLLIFLLTVIGAILGVYYGLNKASCHSYGETYGLTVEHNMSGCYIQVGDRLYPKDYIHGKAIELRNDNLLSE